MSTPPIEVREIQLLHSHLVVAAHAALELALEQTDQPADDSLEGRYRATLGHNISLCLHNELHRRLGDQIQWYRDRGFLAMVPRGTGVAVRLGRCDSHGCPNDTRDRDVGAPFRLFQEGIPLLFDDCDLRPLFGGYSLIHTPNGEAEFEVDRFILAKYTARRHEWSWGLDPVDLGRVRSVLDGSDDNLEVIANEIAIPRQTSFAS